MKLKKSNGNQTNNLKWRQNSKTQMMIKHNILNMTILKNLNCDKT